MCGVVKLSFRSDGTQVRVGKSLRKVVVTVSDVERNSSVSHFFSREDAVALSVLLAACAGEPEVVERVAPSHDA